MRKQILSPGKDAQQAGSLPEKTERINESEWLTDNQYLDLGEEPKRPKFEIQKTREKINERDIFGLAVGILICAGVIIVIFGMLRAFSSVLFSDDQGIREVWDYSKTIFQSIILLVLGLYFGKDYGVKNK